MESTVAVPPGDGILPALFSTEAILLFDTEGTEKTTLLVVDSDRGLLEVCSIVLGRAGYKVLAAEGIRNAFIICRDSNWPAIQLLLLDALCPGTEGVDLVKFLR